MSRLSSRILVQHNRQLLSQEKGTITKSWEGKSSVVLVYPNRYHLGMSNLGFQSTYQLFNNLPNIVCERAFLPEQDEQQELTRSHTPLCSLESFRPLRDFDIIAFSLSFENDYSAILSILKFAAIPFTSAERGNRYPLTIAGGICTFFNPEPLAEFIDLFVIGEAEEVLPQLMKNYQDYHTAAISREDLLTCLSRKEGIYVPQFYDVTYNPSGTIKSFTPTGKAPPTVQRKYTKQLDRFPTCSLITTPETEFADMFLLEVTRGCAHRCNFCSIGCVYTPYRIRSLEKLKETATKGLNQNYKIGLIGATLADYPHINALCKFIIDKGGKFSATSMRVDLLDEELIKLMKQSGHQTITLAPETGSERLRNVIGKNLSNQQIIATVNMVARYQFRFLKLYFLIGLPTEEPEDIDQLIALTKSIQHHTRKSHTRPRSLETITLSINPFIPKPATPFQWHPFENITSLKAKLKKIRNSFKKEKNISVTWDLPKWSYLQCLLSRGDRRVGKILLAAHEQEGNFQKAFKQVDINPDFYIYRQRELDEILPWDFIDHGFNKNVLSKTYKKVLMVQRNQEDLKE
jgi:radical SAM family uncharacterized protein